MRIKNTFKKAIAILLTVLTVLSMTQLAAFATDSEPDSNEGSSKNEALHALVITSDSLTVTVRKKVQLTATVTNTDTQPTITWKSSDESVATVDENGKVKGIKVGKVTIIATAEIDGQVLNGEFTLNVIKKGNFIQDLLTNRQVLSYQYSYVDDYYYTNDKEAWQYNFGFGKIYDFVSPYILLEYDYIRIFFTYEDKDWMIQMWKGQYGMVFFGGEIGVYNREHSEKGYGDWAMYACAPESDWLAMEMTLYWQEEYNGEYVRQFTREYDKYWWCTGFKNGHIRVEEPADELRLEARITFKDETMRELFTQGLEECGFVKRESKGEVGLDEFCEDGKDVYFIWQNISEAESTMAIKVGVGFLSSLAALPFFPLIAPYLGFFLMLVNLVNVIA